MPAEVTLSSYQEALRAPALELLSPEEGVSQHFKEIYRVARVTCDEGRNPDVGAAVTRRDGFLLYTSWELGGKPGEGITFKVVETQDNGSIRPNQKPTETLVPSSLDEWLEVKDTVGQAKKDCAAAKSWQAGYLPWMGYKLGLVPYNFGS